MTASSSSESISEASAYLRELAKESVKVYAEIPGCRAIMLTGSASEGLSDFYSDLDLILFYDQLPSQPILDAAMANNGGVNRRIFGERTETEFGEQYTLKGVECQFAHGTIAGWERDIASVLQDLDVKSPLQKALGGMEEAIPLYGDELIRGWQTKVSQYPDALRDAMVQQHQVFFPLWGLKDRLEPRDATIWVHQVLVENSYNMLAILAGLNRLYFSPFQFKRMARFVKKMQYAPTNCSARLEALFHTDAATAAQQMESLIDETLVLVNQHMPHIDTTQGHARIGWRHQAWKP